MIAEEGRPLTAVELTRGPQDDDPRQATSGRVEAARSSLSALRWRGWLVVAASSVLIAVVVGVPTDLIDTPWFSREIPPTTWSYPVWVVTSALGGLLIGLSSLTAREAPRSEGQRGGMVGGVLTFLAVGCPVCNKVVLMVLGSSGAVTFFEPLQPFIAAASVLLLGWALVRRLSAGRCVPSRGSGVCRR